jgi:hypothetical protein
MYICIKCYKPSLTVNKKYFLLAQANNYNLAYSKMSQKKK